MRNIWIALAALLLAPLTLLAQPEWLESEVVPSAPGRDFKSPGGHTIYIEIFDNRFYAVFLDEERGIKDSAVPWIVLRGHPREFPTETFNVQLSRGSGGVYTLDRLFFPLHDFWMSIVIPVDIQKDEFDVVPPSRFLQE